MQLAVLEPTPEAILVARRQPPDGLTRTSGDVRHVIIFLNDALPDHLLAQMERAPAQVTLAVTLASLCRFEGSCALGYPWNAKSVERALRARDGHDYRLLTWRVLPNHAHVLLEPAPRWPMGDPIHRWKLSSSPRKQGAPRPGLRRFGPDRLRARALRLEQPRPDEFWADEDFERILRTEQEVEDARRLIEAISAPERRPTPPVPPDAEPAADEPEPSASSSDELRIYSAAAASRQAIQANRDSPGRLAHWLGEIAQIVIDLAPLYGGFFITAWVVAIVRRALEH